jgi:hypothetical protein
LEQGGAAGGFFFVQHFLIFPRFLGVGLGVLGLGSWGAAGDFRGQISKNARFFELSMSRIGYLLVGDEQGVRDWGQEIRGAAIQHVADI